MIQEMEKTIAKREQIAVRYKSKNEATEGRGTKTRGGLRVSGDVGAGGGLGNLTTTALKKKVRSCTLRKKRLHVLYAGVYFSARAKQACVFFVCTRAARV